ncbi:HK97 family phage prohead protease [Streptomyces sp. NBC_00354]|uniref:HK97 family phage prohead protease n=1 Tax=Streptomyces sp. NBC_00354 TaxID=2975723 RepID=UPI002E2590D5
MTDTERRFTKVPVELRAQADRKTIGGYAAVFNRQSSNLGGFVEVVDPAAFNASRGDGWPDVIARYNHDDNMLLGSTGSGTLRIMVDGTGLDYEVDPPKARADILELVQRGDVRKSSFAFRTIEDEWGTTDQGFPMRTLLRVQLVDVAPVNTPAYPDSTAGLRSLARHMDADFEEVRKLAEQDELRKFFVRTDPTTGKPKVQEKASYGAAARMALLARKTDPYA